MKRIIIHWTAGTGKASQLDKKHYHFLIEDDGAVVRGDHDPLANHFISRPSDSSTYAAHTAKLNTGSIGIALCGMRGAKQKPFNHGPSPLTQPQIDTLVTFTAELCHDYGIPVTRETVLTHAEVQPTLKVPQSGKWDITWLPGMHASGDPVHVGDKIRSRIKAAMKPVKPVVEPDDKPYQKPDAFDRNVGVDLVDPPKPSGLWDWLKQILRIQT